MSVHYKFKSSIDFSTLPVDGVGISVEDLKEAIIQHKKLSRVLPFDLIISNAETQQEFTDDKTLIPRNSSLLVARVPVSASKLKKHPWNKQLKEPTALILSNPANLMNVDDGGQAHKLGQLASKNADLTRMDGTESDKINAMMVQSTIAYHPTRYAKLRNSKMSGAVHPRYTCHKCSKMGAHWVSDCPLSNQDVRKSYGIPSSQLVRVSDPSLPGVMVNHYGHYVMYKKSCLAEEPLRASTSTVDDRLNLPEELSCKLCEELMKEPVLVPCCGESFCYDCIRDHIFDTAEKRCPQCTETSSDLESLKVIPTLYLRKKCKEFDTLSNGRYKSLKEQKSNTPPVVQPPLPPHLQSVYNKKPSAIKDEGSKETSPVKELFPLQPVNKEALLSSTLIKDVLPMSNLIEDVLPTSNLIKDVLPTSNLIKDVLPTSNLIKHVLPTSNLIKHVLPTSNLIKDVLPTSNLIKDVLPTSNLIKHVLPTSNLIKHVLPTSNLIKHVLPTSNLIKDVLPTSNLVKGAVKSLQEPLYQGLLKDVEENNETKIEKANKKTKKEDTHIKSPLSPRVTHCFDSSSSCSSTREFNESDTTTDLYNIAISSSHAVVPTQYYSMHQFSVTPPGYDMPVSNNLYADLPMSLPVKEDPLTAFTRIMQEKDERKRLEAAYKRRSPSYSYYRTHSRSPGRHYRPPTARYRRSRSPYSRREDSYDRRYKSSQSRYVREENGRLERNREDINREERGREDGSREGRGREDRNREERGREDRNREERGREDRNREERGREDRNREERGREDRNREERGREDRNRDERGREEKLREERRRYDRNRVERIREERGRDERTRMDRSISQRNRDDIPSTEHEIRRVEKESIYDRLEVDAKRVLESRRQDKVSPRHFSDRRLFRTPPKGPSPRDSSKDPLLNRVIQEVERSSSEKSGKRSRSESKHGSSEGVKRPNLEKELVKYEVEVEVKQEEKDKKKHDKKKKDKRNSQLSEISLNDAFIPDIKKEKKERVSKEETDYKMSSVVDTIQSETIKEAIVNPIHTVNTPAIPENNSRTSDLSDISASLLPELSKWERDDYESADSTVPPKGVGDTEKSLVTTDVIRKAESALFNNKGKLGYVALRRKIHLESQKMKDLQNFRNKEHMEDEMIDKVNMERDAGKKKIHSIQITISSKNETENIGKKRVSVVKHSISSSSSESDDSDEELNKKKKAKRKRKRAAMEEKENLKTIKKKNKKDKKKKKKKDKKKKKASTKDY